MRLGTHQECVGISPRVSGVCQDGTREFARRRARLARRLSGVAEKLVGNDVVGSRRSSLGDSPKGSGSSLGTRRKISRRRPKDLPQECRRLPDWRELGLSLACWLLSVVIIES
ncbi:hypothetical protein BHE74_00011369 [Ensete ventricosum]|nr:hypothetical protein GW17_00041884 [Ensete ventricosum]RWW80295.1 hypothetical protein BHE74_00011369 [Ensete ventricosum]RZS28229.1 hypothetical protein BHM03_00061798 [Ensete ventricosum]